MRQGIWESASDIVAGIDRRSENMSNPKGNRDGGAMSIEPPVSIAVRTTTYFQLSSEAGRSRRIGDQATTMRGEA
jgi:hypothetical protein